jgi:hypothetical protein
MLRAIAVTFDDSVRLFITIAPGFTAKFTAKGGNGTVSLLGHLEQSGGGHNTVALCHVVTTLLKVVVCMQMMTRTTRICTGTWVKGEWVASLSLLG